MNGYEKLEEEAYQNGIHVIDYDFNSEKIKGLYCDGTIGLNKNLDSLAEKSCVLAEELGHHYTSTGNIIDMAEVKNRKQERQARLWAYNKIIGLRGIIDAYEYGCRNLYEAAEYLEVTEEFLKKCVDCYRAKYGVGKMIDNYYIMFIPHLMVGKIVN